MAPGTESRRGRSLPEKVAQWYYAHGLFCSTYPTCATTLAITVVLLCCYPLLNIPLPGNIPMRVTYPAVSINNYDLNSNGVPNAIDNISIPIKLGLTNLTQEVPYLWAKTLPYAYVQQIVLKIGVIPWDKDLYLTDAFRSPLFEVFKLLEIVRNHQDEKSTKTLGHLCLHVENVKRRSKAVSSVLPEYSCLVLSPANLWQQNSQQFNEDSNLLGTIFEYQNLQKGKVSTAEMLFGMHLKDTGIKRYPLRNRQRILQYSVTLFFKEYDPSFILTLKDKLVNIYPLHQNISTAGQKSPEITFIYYPGEFNWMEFLPLTTALVIVFLYFYFSVRKMELIKSKISLAICTVLTILASLTMSLGLCFFFGLTISMPSREIFPYLVILLGLENVLVLTKSVVSTDVKLDVKIRVAQGLSKEGWSISKNILIELTIMTIGLLTFVPVIQELCIFLIVGLVSDFFMQMLFFTTVLAIDTRRLDYSDTNKMPKYKPYYNTQYNKNQTNLISQDYNINNPTNLINAQNLNHKMKRSKSHPRLNGLNHVSVNSVSSNIEKKKIPKRLRLMNIWARTRFFQRAFMIWMIVWISRIIYNSGFLEQFFVIETNETISNRFENGVIEESVSSLAHDMKIGRLNHNLEHKFYNTPLPDMGTESSLNIETTMPDIKKSEEEVEKMSNQTDELKKLKHLEFDSWMRLSNFHWSAILKQYNLSLSGNYITILPPIKISHVVTSEQAEQVRHPDEKVATNFQWQSLAAALDPLDIADSESEHLSLTLEHETPFYPSSPMELFLITILCIISVCVLAYTMVVLYRCVCSRNYAEWRASWNEGAQGTPSTQLVLEAVPLSLRGHSHNIECAVTDGSHVASCCLTGQLKVWDTANGQLMANIDRKTFFGLQQNMSKFSVSELDVSQSKDENFLSDYESGSPPSRDEMTIMQSNKINVPSLKEKINTNFSDLKLENTNLINRNKFNFDLQFKKLYLNENEFDHDIISEEQTNFKNNVNNLNIAENLDKENCKIYTTKKTNQSLNEQNNCTNCYQIPNPIKHRNAFNEIPESCTCVTTIDSNVNSSRSLPQSPAQNITSNTNLTNEQRTHQDYNTHLRRNYSNMRHRLKSLENNNVPQIWCLDFLDNLIAIGCANGRLEFWEGTTGKFKCMFEDEHCVGVTSLKLIGDRMVAAKLNGSLEFYQLESYSSQGKPVDWGFSSAYRRTHMRTGSAGSITEINIRNGGDSLRCVKLASLHAHQQPITVLDCLGYCAMTGSQDHTIKVFKVDDQSCLFTLHGHCGPISCLAIDQTQPNTAMSGSQDGLMCVWDLVTGACMYSTQAHSGCVEGVTCSASYVISLGSDNRLCIWDRFQGHLLNAISMPHTYSSSMLMLSHCLLVTARAGGLVVWDVRTGEPARQVALGDRVTGSFVRHLLTDGQSVICDYGSELRVVRFPLLGDKDD